MIFSSVEFFVFLALLLVAIGLTRREAPRRNVLIGRQLPLLRLVGLALLLPAARRRAGGLPAGRGMAGRPTAARGKALAGGGRSREPRRCWRSSSTRTSSLANLQPLFRVAGLELPRPEVLLPVGISFFTFQSHLLPHRRLPRHAAGAPEPAGLHAVRLVLPATAGRPHRARRAVPAADGARAPAARRRPAPGHRALRARLHQEGAVRRHARGVGGPRVRAPGGLLAGHGWLAVLAYAGQIYYDFSGYTDMAIGVARMLGIEYPENFRHPYRPRRSPSSGSAGTSRCPSGCATTCSCRWPTPLAPHRGGPPLGVRAETWSYAGAILRHDVPGRAVARGVVDVRGVGRAARPGARRPPDRAGRAREARRAPRGARVRPLGVAGKAGSWAGTFLFLLVTWVFFRAPDFTTAWAMLRRMAFLGGTGGIEWYYVQGIVALGDRRDRSTSGALRHGDRSPALDLRRPLAWPALAALLLALVLFAPVGTSPFIYLQF